MSKGNALNPFTVFSNEADLPRVAGPVSPSARLGELLVRAGAMTEGDIERVLKVQAASTEKFGEIAVRLGLVRRQQVDAALALQNDFPLIPTGSSSISPVVATAYEPAGGVAESMRTLRAQLLARWYNTKDAWPALAITGVERGEGRSFIAANLAVAFAQMGKRTLLIDGDLRNPIQHQTFNLPNRLGFAGILAGRAGLPEICLLERMPGLSVLTAGSPPPNPQELIARERFGMLLHDLSRRFEIVLIDTPASVDSADAQMIAIQARGAFIVSRRNVTRQRLLVSHRVMLEQVGVSVVGLAYNEC